MHQQSVGILVVTIAVAVLGLASVGVAIGQPHAEVRPSLVGTVESVEPPEEAWNRTYDGPGDEIFSSIVPTDDGYLLTGWTERDGTDHGWIVVVDEEGRERWSEVVGEDGTDRLYGGVRTDEGYLLAGRTDAEGQPHGWLVLADDGGVEGQQIFEDRTGAFWAVDRTDSEILLGGWSSENGTAGWLVAVDEDGEVQWERTYDVGEGNERTYVKTVVADEDGALLAGTIESSDGVDAWAGKVDESGKLVWSRTYGEAPHDDVWAATATDSGYALAGETGGTDSSERDAWVVGISSDGEVLWERTVGEDGHDWFDSATATDDGLLFTGGTATGGIGNADGLVVSTDSDGVERWRTIVGTPRWDKPWPAIATDDGGYLLAGHTAGYGTDGTGGWLVRLTPETSETTTSVDASTPGEGTVTGESPDRTRTGAVEETTRSAPDRTSWYLDVAIVVGITALAIGVLLARR